MYVQCQYKPFQPSPKDVTPRMATAIKSKRRQVRISPEDDSVIRAAAERSEQSVSSYLVESALVRAQTEMADRTHVVLDEADWNAFTAALDAPPVKNERLQETIKRARAVSS